MLKYLPLLLLLIAALSAAGRLAVAAEPVAPAPGTERVAGRVGEASAPAAHGEGHGEIDERLVPIPPSRDTVVSAVWVIVIFLVMVAILYPTAWKNVLAGLKKREERIRGDIAEAEAARGKAEQTLKDYNARLATAEQQVRDLLQKASAEAQQIADGIRTRAQQDAQEAKEKATADIERAKNDAIGQIYDQAATLATSVAEKILQRNLNPDDQRDLVNRSLEQLKTIGRN